MHTYPSRVSPVVGALTTVVGRWLSQDAARANAALAAAQLEHQRRELEEVTRFLASRHPDASEDQPGTEERSAAPP